MFIRSEEGLSRDTVKHLNSIEEQVLECRAWARDSALWEALDAAHMKVPTVEEVRITPKGPLREVPAVKEVRPIWEEDTAADGCLQAVSAWRAICVFHVMEMATAIFVI